MGNEPIITVTANDASITPGTIGITPAGQPNVIFKAFRPVFVVFIRAVRTFLQTALSGATIASLSGTLLPGDILSKLKVAAVFSIGATVVSIGQNILEIFTELNKKYPDLMG